ncbi:hypothetical protein AB1Y20_022440 [Prymnesium parvum]|uniref:Uncharacterized protein n=1 Tax=Prymnesium parvum TaxID=97485 RepID=A0AB34JH38_PRYPA
MMARGLALSLLVLSYSFNVTIRRNRLVCGGRSGRFLERQRACVLAVVAIGSKDAHLMHSFRPTAYALLEVHQFVHLALNFFDLPAGARLLHAFRHPRIMTYNVPGLKILFWKREITAQLTSRFSHVWFFDSDMDVHPERFDLITFLRLLEATNVTIMQPAISGEGAGFHNLERRSAKGLARKCGLTTADRCAVCRVSLVEVKTPIFTSAAWQVVQSAFLERVPDKEFSWGLAEGGQHSRANGLNTSSDALALTSHCPIRAPFAFRRWAPYPTHCCPSEVTKSGHPSPSVWPTPWSIDGCGASANDILECGVYPCENHPAAHAPRPPEARANGSLEARSRQQSEFPDASADCEMVPNAFENCSASVNGSWKLRDDQATDTASAARACRCLCASCERCRYFSVSICHKDCSWSWDYPLAIQLQRDMLGFHTFELARSSFLKLLAGTKRGTNGSLKHLPLMRVA